MNTELPLTPVPKSIELSRKGWAVLLPCGDFSIHQGGVGMYVYAEDFQQIISGFSAAMIGQFSFPTPKAKEEPKDRFGDVERDLIGRLHTAKFLQNCKTVVIESPLNDECPMGSKSEPWVFTRGECYGKGCINDNMEIDLYNGETKPLRNILVILPS